MKLSHIFDVNMDIHVKQVPIVGIKQHMSLDVPSENVLQIHFYFPQGKK